MKRSNSKTKAFAFLGAAALITAALLAVSLLFTACPNSAGGTGSGSGSTGGGGTPPADGYDAATGKGVVGGVEFTMKSIVAVTDKSIGHTGQTDNQPHTVSLTAYRIGETEVTQEL